MYNRPKQVTSPSQYALTPYIEGNDLLNSKFIFMLRKLKPLRSFTVGVQEYRIDLICKGLDVSTDLADLILIYNGISILELTKGTVLKMPSLLEVQELSTELNTISNPEKFIVKMRKISI